MWNSGVKILALADIHGDLEKLYKLIDNLEEKPDLVVVAGDLTPFGNSDLVPKIRSALKKATPYAFMIPGNEDPEDVRRLMAKENLDMHGKYRKIKDTTLVGFEGARWVESEGHDFPVYDPIHKVMKKIKGKKILVSHVPPFDTKTDKLFTGHHVGSPFLRSLIEEYQPDLVVCGHIHESRGVDKIGRTKVLNTGALADGYAAWVDTDKMDISFLKLGRRGLKKITGKSKSL